MIEKIMIRKRIVGKHSKNCCAKEQVKSGWWQTVWGPAEGIVFKNINGQGNGNTVWIKIVCNDPDCSAILLLNEDDILKIAKE